MKVSKKFFKPYLFIIFTLGIAIITYYLTNIQNYTFPLASIFFMLITVISEAFDYDGEVNSDELTFSLSISNTIFLIFSFNPLIAILGITFGQILRGIKLKFIGEYQKVMNVKLFFNISQIAVCIFIADFLSESQKIIIDSPINVFKIAMIILIYDILNRLVVSLVISFHSGKLFLEAFKLKFFLLYNYYSIVLTLALIYSYRGFGTMGAVIVYLMYLPFQTVTFKYTKMKEKERELFKDRLSGAYNYRYLVAYLNNKIERKEQFAICMMDFNNLKFINDNYGHVTGNTLIEFFAQIVNSVVDNNTVFCRYGGDEFCLIHNNYDELKSYINKINEKLKTNALETNGLKLYTSVSAGLYKYTGENLAFEQIIDKVDKAMYKSKHKKNSELVEAL